jgi:hypothetical protein
VFGKGSGSGYANGFTLGFFFFLFHCFGKFGAMLYLGVQWVFIQFLSYILLVLFITLLPNSISRCFLFLSFVRILLSELLFSSLNHRGMYQALCHVRCSTLRAYPVASRNSEAWHSNCYSIMEYLYKQQKTAPPTKPPVPLLRLSALNRSPESTSLVKHHSHALTPAWPHFHHCFSVTCFPGLVGSMHLGRLSCCSCSYPGLVLCVNFFLLSYSPLFKKKRIGGAAGAPSSVNKRFLFLLYDVHSMPFCLAALCFTSVFQRERKRRLNINSRPVASKLLSFLSKSHRFRT